MATPSILLHRFGRRLFPWVCAVLLHVMAVPEAAAYPMVKYVRFKFRSADVSYSGGYDGYLTLGGFAPNVSKYWNADGRDELNPANVVWQGSRAGSKPDALLLNGNIFAVLFSADWGRNDDKYNWIELDPPMTFPDAVKAMASCNYVSSDGNGWLIGHYRAHFFVYEGNSQVMGSPVDSTVVAPGTDWRGKNQPVSLAALANEMSKQYDSPLVLSAPKNSWRHMMDWNQSSTFTFSAYDADGALAVAIEDSDNEEVQPLTAIVASVNNATNVAVKFTPARGKYGSNVTINLKLTTGANPNKTSTNINLTLNVAQKLVPGPPEAPPKPAIFPTLVLGPDSQDGRMRANTSKSFNWTVTDPDSTPEQVSLSAASSNPSVLPASAIRFGDGKTTGRVMTIDGSSATPGTTTITVTAKNKYDNTTNKTLVVTVRPDSEVAGQPAWRNSTTGLGFNGTSDVVLLPESVWAEGDLTMEGWVLVRRHVPYAAMMELGNGPLGNRIALVLSYGDNGGRAALVGDRDGVTMAAVATRALPLNQWTHVAATLEKGRARVYYDGVLVADGSVIAPAGVTRKVNMLGQSTFDSAAFMDGKLDEVRLWSGARSEDDLVRFRFPVAALATLTANSSLVGYWPMNDRTGNAVKQEAAVHGKRTGSGDGTALFPIWTVGVPTSMEYNIDEDSAGQSIPLSLASGSGSWSVKEAPRYGTVSSSGGALAATVTYRPRPDFNSGSTGILPDGMTVSATVGSTTLAPQRVNITVKPANDAPRADTTMGLRFSGGFLSLPGSAASLTRPQAQEFTLEAWISPSPGGGPIISKRGEYYLGLDAALRLWFYRADRRDRALISTNPLPVSQWVHVAASFDGSIRNLFVNGEQVAFESGTGEEGVLVTQRSHDVTVGGTEIGAEPAKLFNGGIDEVRVWGRALGASELARVMNRTLRGDGGDDESGLMAYYRLDEGQGVVAHDGLAPTSNGPAPMDGILSGSVTWSSRGTTLTNWVDEDTLTQFSLPASDVDRNPGRATGARDRLTFRITRSPGQGVLVVQDPQSGLVTYRPFKDYTGSDSFEYTVVDESASASRPQTVNVHVINVNDPPVIAPLPNLTVPDSEGVTTVPVHLSDLDGPQAPYVTAIRIDPPTLLASTNVVLVTNSTGGLELHVTPPVANYGTARISVSATDGEAITVATFNVSFIPSLVYHVIDLGELAQDPVTEVVAVDDSGRAGGSIGSGASQRGLLFGNLLSGGSLQDTGLTGANHRVSGLAVGTGGSPTYEVGSYFLTTASGGASVTRRHAYRRVDGVTTTNFSWPNGSEAVAVNRLGTMVGVATNLGVSYPFFLTAGINRIQNPPNLINALARGVPVGIDELDRIVGYTLTNNGVAIAWVYDTANTNLSLVAPPSGFGSVRPSAISEKGTAIAASLARTSDGRPVAAMYSGATTQWRILGTSWISSRAHGVNNSLQCVGEAEVSAGVTNAFLVSNSKAFNLNDLTAPDSPWTLERAVAINNVGHIVGQGRIRTAAGGSERRAFLAVPANVIGMPVPRPLGAVARAPVIELLSGRSTDTPQQSFIWGEKEKTLYAVRPVTARISWPTTTDLASTNARSIAVFAANLWPSQPQVHAAGAPVIVQPEVSPWPYSFLQQAYSSVDGSVLDQQSKTFTSQTNKTGYTVWHYLRTDGLPADPTSQTNHFTVVRTYTVPELLANMHLPAPMRTNKADVPWPIGTPIVDAEHKDLAGRNGFVFHQKSAYDAVGALAAYDRSQRMGSILPVNRINKGMANPAWNDDDLVVIWYSLNHLGVSWAERPVRYIPEWPANAPAIVIASALGTSPHGPLSSVLYPKAHIYNQPDGTLPGFNPNEEHALMLGDVAYALRSDLNTIGSTKYSEPFVLVKYEDRDTSRWSINVYKVVAEQAPYFFRYPGVAGTEIQPPLPLAALTLCPSNYVTSGTDIAIKDYKGKIHARAAGVDGTLNTNLVVRFFYALQPDFYWPTQLYGIPSTFAGNGGSWVPWLDRLPGGTQGVPLPVRFEVRWPDNAPVLDVGESLLRSKKGLPNVMDMASVRVVYDSIDPGLNDPANASAMKIGAGFLTGAPTNLARLYDPMSERSVRLGATVRLPDSIRLWDGPAGRRLFADLPYVLRLRLTYDPMGKALCFKGYLDESQIGEPLLLPNVMTESERDQIQDLDGKNNNTSFDKAIDDLFWLTRNPNRLDLDRDGLADKSLLVGLQYRRVAVATNVVVGLSTNAVTTYQFNTNYLEFESLPGGPKALTAAFASNPPAPPRPGHALSLANNRLSNHLLVTNMPVANLDQFTWEAWVNRAGANSEDIVVAWGTDHRRAQAGFREDGYFYFDVAGVTLLSDARFTDTGEWHHWAGVYDSVAMAMFLYRDGEVVGQADMPEATHGHRPTSCASAAARRAARSPASTAPSTRCACGPTWPAPTPRSPGGETKPSSRGRPAWPATGRWTARPSPPWTAAATTGMHARRGPLHGPAPRGSHGASPRDSSPSSRTMTSPSPACRCP